MYCTVMQIQTIDIAIVYCAGIFKQSMGARNRVVIGLSYRLARQHRLEELIHWNRFLGSLKVSKFGLCTVMQFQIIGIAIPMVRIIDAEVRYRGRCQF